MATIYKAINPMIWVDVTKKAGPDTGNDCIVITMDGEIHRAYYSPKGKWYHYNCGCYDEIIEYVEYWMEMPKF